MTKVERPLLKYFGGKWALAEWIVSFFPSHRIYCEPFGGGASVLLQKPRAYSEVYNDLDGEVVNVFRVMQSDFEKLKHALLHTPFSREEYDLAWMPSENALERARRTIVRSHMGMGDATTAAKKTGFRARSELSGTSKSDNWVSYVDKVDQFHSRLRGVVIENRDAKEVMAQQDGANTLHFVDPPYLADTRQTAVNYRHEMSDTEHEQLCDFLKTLKGMVILCGYANPTYSRLEWETRERRALADGGNERTETLWLNPACIAAQSQQRLAL